MKTEWDYSTLAQAYLKRPDYAESAIDKILSLSSISKSDKLCDVGAGVAHLTIPLAKRGFEVVAVEPNDNMRQCGIERTKQFSNVRFVEGTGEHTGQADHDFALVTFGSSFNVCDRQQALAETARILKSRAWFACLWNHRDLDDPIQRAIEEIIESMVPNYSRGVRREDQTQVINQSNLFDAVQRFDGKVNHVQTIDDCVEAWRSHATLERQAGSKFADVVTRIEAYLRGLGKASIEIPYTTNVWMAQLRA